MVLKSDQDKLGVDGVHISAKSHEDSSDVLTAEALEFIAELHRKFNPVRKQLLARRSERRQTLLNGGSLTFPAETADIRKADWKVTEAPADLLDRRVEITGPVEQKMMINALNSGANVFMADFEDALSPTWANVVQGQRNLCQAVRRNLSFTSPEGKAYRLHDKLATLVVRPRGWHLQEEHVTIDGEPISASLFDFGLYLFHNAAELLSRESGPYFYLPKMESHLEARLWNDVFSFSESRLGLPGAVIRATVLIETILAAFEMDEILYELKDHASGLNAGRWDYMFSIIKNFCNNPDFILPDRAQVTMKVPFMKAYCDLLVQTCHKRNAHAMGGMSAFVPSRKDAKINEAAFAAVKEDKEREANHGFDGTWVAHPDLVPVARSPFDKILGWKPNQKDRINHEVATTADQLLNTAIAGGKITEAGLTNNIDVGLQYIESWLRGIGAAAIHNLMEDAATAEIARSQIWQWIWNKAALDDGRQVTLEMYKDIKSKVLAALTANGPGRYRQAERILDDLTSSETFLEFLTVPAYAILISDEID